MKTRTKKPGASRRLTTTLAIAFLGLSVVVLLISSGLQVLANTATQLQAVSSKLQLNAQQASQSVSTFIQDKFIVLDTGVHVANLTAGSSDERRQILEGLLSRDGAFRQLVVLNAQDQEAGAASRLPQIASEHLADRLSSETLAQIKQGQRYISSIYIDPGASEPLIVMALPVVNALGDFQGTLAAEVNLKFMWNVVEKIKVQETGVAYVVNKQGDLLAFKDTARVLRGENVANLNGVRQFISGPSSVSTPFLDLSIGIQGISVVGAYAPLGTPDWAVVTELPWDEAYREVIQNLVTAVAILLTMAVFAGLVGVYVARRLAVPLVSLTSTATRIAAGELELQATAGGPREVGTLAQAFNSMTAQLRDLINSLETRVEVRTAQLSTSADVGQAAASILDPDQLLHEVVNLITDRFGFYYTAVFMPDETGKWLVLREATGEAGHILKERGHKLAMDEPSMSGYVFRQRKPRIAFDVGTEAVRFANPLLPDTRSEIALPLIVGDRVLGALDVQSTQSAAFDEANAAVLQSMANQIAVALSNAEQFKQTDMALQRTRDLYTASQALDAANEPSDVLAALIQHIAPDANRAGIMRFGPREADGELSYVEFVAAWAPSDFSAVPPKDGDQPIMQPIQIGTRFTPQQMPLVKYVAPGRPFIVPDSNDPALDPPVRGLMQRFGAQAFAALPLVVGQQTLGIIVVGYRAPRQFDADHLQAMQTLTGHTAIVLQNLQSAADTQAALAQLDAINRRLTGEAWSDFARRRGAEGVRWISTMDRHRTANTQRVQAAPSSGGTDRAQPADLPEVGEALSTGQITTRPFDGSDQLGIAVPIKVRGVSIGALRLVVPQTAWNDELRTTLDSIAGHVAQSAENVRLMEATQRAAQRDKDIAGAADKIHHSTDLETVLHAAIAEVGRITGLDGISVQLGFGPSHQEMGIVSSHQEMGVNAVPSKPINGNGHGTGTEGAQ